MEVANSRKPEDDIHMANRLLATLNHQEEMRCQKRRWILNRRPDKVQKRQKCSFLTEKYVPESDLREEKDIFGIRSLIERTLDTNDKKDVELHSSQTVNFEEGVKLRSCLIAPPSDFRLDKLEGMSHWELLRMSPFLLGCLNRKALADLYYTFSGRHPMSKNRLIIEKDVQQLLFNSTVLFTMDVLPEPLLKAALILCNRHSLRHSFQMKIPHVKAFSQMPPSAIAAARQIFAHVDKLPTWNLEEVLKALIANCKVDLKVHDRVKKSHGLTVNRIRKKASQILDYLIEGDVLPLPIDRALHVISLSARVVYGDDGGLIKLLRPLSSVQQTLEDGLLAAFSQLRRMKAVELANVYDIIVQHPQFIDIGMNQSLHVARNHAFQLQKIFTSSMHCIYGGTFPEPVAIALSVINLPTESTVISAQASELKFKKGRHTSEQIVSDLGCSALTQENKREERIMAELEAVLLVSAQLQSLVWEYCESFEKYGHKVLHELGNITNRARTLTVSANDIDLPVKEAVVDVEKFNLSCASGSDPVFSGLGVPAKNAEVRPIAERIHMENLLGTHAQEDTVMSESKTFDVNNQDFIEAVESIADEAATIAYHLIGCILNEMAMSCPRTLEFSTAESFQTGLEDLRASGENSVRTFKSIQYMSVSKLVLSAANKLEAIPKEYSIFLDIFGILFYCQLLPLHRECD